MGEPQSKRTRVGGSVGNRSFDERGVHAFNARSQLVRWQRPDATGAGAPPAGHSYAEEPGPMEARGVTHYTLDGTGQTIERESDLDFKATLKNVPPGQERPPAREHTLERYRYSDGDLSQVVATTTRVTDTTLIPEPQRTTKTRTTSNFAPYDDLGNVREIKTETESFTPGDDPPDPELPKDPPASVPGCAAEIGGWNDAETTYHCYDPFGRLVATQAPKPKPTNPNGPPEPDKPTFSFIYDGLDRRDLGLESQDDGPSSTVSERSYVGTSELLSREARPDDDVASRDYAYDSAGQRLGASVDELGPAAARFKGYERDANGSVVGLEDESSGEVGSTDAYDYDPYGSLLDPDPGDDETTEEELSADAADNPFRFEGFYYDSGIESYDMQARQYRPDIGRFLSQDRFEAAGADLALQSDPLTQNRYAFAGGNPVSRIEFDGHLSCLDDCGPGDTVQGVDGEVRQQAGSSPPEAPVSQEVASEAYEASAAATAGTPQNREAKVVKLTQEVNTHPGLGLLTEGETSVVGESVATGKPSELRGSLLILDYAAESRAETGFTGFAQGFYFAADGTFTAFSSDPLGTLKASVESIPDLVRDPSQVFECSSAVTTSNCNGERFFGVFGTRGAGNAFNFTPNRFASPGGAAKVGDDVPGLGSNSYVDITKGGSIRNVGTNASHTDFADNLRAGGWTSRQSKDGAVEIFEQDGARYVLRNNADSYSGWTADYAPSGSQGPTLKIRLGYP